MSERLTSRYWAAALVAASGSLALAGCSHQPSDTDSFRYTYTVECPDGYAPNGFIPVKAEPADAEASKIPCRDMRDTLQPNVPAKIVPVKPHDNWELVVTYPEGSLQPGWKPPEINNETGVVTTQNVKGASLEIKATGPTS
ncbi:MAG TPA: hypothetical protein VFL85_05390 [Candidatus Saccharimonadales bacterium]|nr:hypothetical protein [Candidatus Saccharimonadales bacterium]